MPSVIVKIDPQQIENGSIATAKLADLPGLATALTPHLNFEGGGPHTHAIDDVTGLTTALAGKAASSHGHAAGEVTGLAQVATTGDGGHLVAASVTNARLADMATGTIKGCVSGTRPADLTGAQVTALLSTFTTGGVKGVVPGSSGGTTNYLRADGTWAAPPAGGGGPTVVVLAADVTNNNAVANTLADVTGIAFPVVAGETYWFEAVIAYTAQATTTGSRWVLNGPALTMLNLRSEWTLTATTITANCASAYNIPAACNATSLAAGNIATLWGIVKPSANGTVQVRFASEVANSAITAKAGSTLRWMKVL